MKRYDISKRTSKYLPKFQRTNEEEVNAEFEAHKYRLKKTGSAEGAAKMKKDNEKIRAESIKKRKAGDQSSDNAENLRLTGSFIQKRGKL